MDPIFHDGGKFSYNISVKRMAYQRSLKVSFHHPCLEQFATILSSRTIMSLNVGLNEASGFQHSSTNLHDYFPMYPK